MEDKDLIDKAIRIVIKEKRIELNKTQGEYSNDIGISEKHLSRIERGVKNTSGSSFFKILSVQNDVYSFYQRIKEVIEQLKSKE